MAQPRRKRERQSIRRRVCDNTIGGFLGLALSGGFPAASADLFATASVAILIGEFGMVSPRCGGDPSRWFWR